MSNVYYAQLDSICIAWPVHCVGMGVMCVPPQMCALGAVLATLTLEEYAVNARRDTILTEVPANPALSAANRAVPL